MLCSRDGGRQCHTALSVVAAGAPMFVDQFYLIKVARRVSNLVNTISSHISRTMRKVIMLALR